MFIYLISFIFYQQFEFRLIGVSPKSDYKIFGGLKFINYSNSSSTYLHDKIIYEVYQISAIPVWTKVMSMITFKFDYKVKNKLPLSPLRVTYEIKLTAVEIAFVKISNYEAHYGNLHINGISKSVSKTFSTGSVRKIVL